MFPLISSASTRLFLAGDDAFRPSAPPSSPSQLSSLDPTYLSRSLQILLSSRSAADSLRREAARMFSTHPPTMNHGNSPGPFGYNFIHDDSLNPPPPEPELGHQPLLNDPENAYLQDFYIAQQRGDSALTDHYADTMGQFTDQDHGLRGSFGDASTDGARRTQGLLSDLSWLQTEPPPNVHRVSATPRSAISPMQQVRQRSHQHVQQQTTPMSPVRQVPQHLPHQSPQQDSLGFSFSHNMDMPNSSNDVLGAASILTQPYSNQQSAFHQSMLQDDITTTPFAETVQTSSPIVGYSAGSGNHHEEISPHQTTGFFNFPPSLVDSAPPAQEMSSINQRASSPQIVEPSRGEEPADANARLYHFGSDNHFHSNGFIPASEHDRHEVRAEYLTEELRRLRPINRDEVGTSGVVTPEITQGKKRKVSPTADEPQRTDGDGSRDQSLKNPPARKSVGRGRGQGARRQSQADVHSTKRRRSSLSGPKPPLRDHLTEEQKRSNHIQSEQKRRTAIAQGFSALHDLVPELIIQGGGLSKSNVLIEAVTFLEVLHRNNAEIKRRLGTQ